MTLLILSFIAGVLTVAAPCILPLLPVIVGGSLLSSSEDKQERQWLRPLIIAASLAGSVVIFTLALKATTALLGVPQYVWQIFSGAIITLLGINFLMPSLWKRMPLINKLNLSSNKLLGKSYSAKNNSRDVLIGVSLGPVFASCSPTYSLIVATVLPASFLQGFIYLIAYAVGLASTLLLVSYAGQSVIAKLKWLSDPSGWFSRIVGIIFIAVGLFVLFGLDKKVQSFVLERGWYDPISNLEQRFKR
ncbi:MAG: sulfite exporter TauE/SafE family protein [bacterium]|nr:sulfite exporter TauE/SafE family protein [bacterium]